ncbi:MAG: 50S ribosomal protein L32 [Candidatus Uhrbacteria bacterium]|nr:50S ribosomal protein L32 [Candidatus Uhrbacteria bacterium]
MSVPAFKNSRSRVRRRRSHQALKKTDSSNCLKCDSPILPHRACTSCGYYKNRQVVGGMESVEKAIDKKTKKSREVKSVKEGEGGAKLKKEKKSK